MSADPITLPPFEQLQTSYDVERRILWYRLAARKPCFTLDILSELREFQDRLASQLAKYSADDIPVRYLVGGSVTPGIFNLGGDLAYFVSRVTAKDEAGLADYARRCVDVLHANVTNLSLPLTTISLVQGDALGGGFEAALSSNVIIAERKAKLGFPEVLFNMIPGMGGYSLLLRRVDPATAERVLSSGINYTADELADMRIVDIVAEEGKGRQCVEQYVFSHRHRSNSDRLLFQMRARVHPLSIQELYDIAEMWAAAAMSLSRRDLAVMSRLVALQSSLPRGETRLALDAKRGDIPRDSEILPASRYVEAG